jgi:hypothetical protein
MEFNSEIYYILSTVKLEWYNSVISVQSPPSVSMSVSTFASFLKSYQTYNNLSSYNRLPILFEWEF